MSAAVNRAAIWAGVLIEELARAGVRHAVVSPGSRSAPLALACAECAQLELHVVLDERAAGFFALGLARQSGQPTLLVCTSGTAAANYLPAVLEADLGRTPLVVLTADRPPEQRDCGAGQTIDQLGLYGGAVRWFAELPAPRLAAESIAHLRAVAGRAVGTARRTPAGPVHLNQPLREPLWPRADEAERAAFAALPEPLQRGRAAAATWLRDGAGDERLQASPQTVARIARELGGEPRGWLVAGALEPDPGLGDALAELAQGLGWPILADALSGLREHPRARGHCVDAPEVLLRSARWCAEQAPRACLRFGAMPTSKALRERLEALPELALFAVDPAGHREPTHLAQELVRADAQSFARQLAGALPTRTGDAEFARRWRAAGARGAAALNDALGAQPALSGPGAIAAVAAAVPAGARIFAGNSMPVRELDGFWPLGARELRFFANRGANGIDGTLSSALGAAAADPAPLVALIGDLALLHDWHAVLLALRERRAPLAVVVLDNGGGGIFEFLPVAQTLARERFEQLFATPQHVDLERALRGFGAPVRTVRSRRELEEALRKRLVEPGAEFLIAPLERAGSAAQQRALFALAERAALDSDGAP